MPSHTGEFLAPSPKVLQVLEQQPNKLLLKMETPANFRSKTITALKAEINEPDRFSLSS